MEILLLEQPTRNRGDESAHRGVVQQLLIHYPDAHITVTFYGNTKDEIEAMRVLSKNVDYVDLGSSKGMFSYHRLVKLLLMLRLPILLYFLPKTYKYLCHIRKADFVVGAPGGIEMGGFMGWFHVALFWLVKQEKKPCFYFGRSIGPFGNKGYFGKLFKSYCSDLLRQFTFLSLRDAKSQEIAKDMQISYYPTIDSAFLREVENEFPACVKQFIEDEKYFVFVPNALVWHHAYREFYTLKDMISFWAGMLNVLMNEYPSHKVVMLPQTTMVPWIYEGFPFFEDVRKASSNSDRVYVLPDTYGSDAQQTIIRGADFLVGARYHSVIFSINQNVPFVSLSYEHKMSGVLELLKKQNCEIRLDELLKGKRLCELDLPMIYMKVVGLTHSITNDLEAQQTARRIALEGFKQFTYVVNRHVSL